LVDWEMVKMLRGFSARRGKQWWMWGGLVVAVVLLIAMGLGRLHQAGPAAEDPVWARVMERGELRVGMDASWPPFEDIDEDSGEIYGLDVDLARELGQRLGVEVTFVNSGFDGLYDALAIGRFDAIISALPYNPRRTQEVLYSISYFDAGQVLVVATGAAIREVDDLRGRTLAVETGSEGDVLARRLRRRMPDMQIAHYNVPQEALEAVRSGEADAALVDAVSAYQFIGRLVEGRLVEGGLVDWAAVGEASGMRIVGKPLTDEHYVIAVRRDAPRLLEAINEALLEMREDGSLDMLIWKWMRCDQNLLEP